MTSNNLITRSIPKTGELLPVVGLGSYKTFDVGARSQDRIGPRSVLDTFAQAGGRLIDSSPMYGSAESVIGDSIESLRLPGKLFVATKVWTSGRVAGERQMEDSLRKLKVSSLDLMQVHNLLDVETHLDTLESWKQDGRVRYVGVTHYTAGAHDSVEKILRSRKIDFMQINYSLVEREAESSLLPLAVERGVAVIVNRPFAGGSLLRRLRSRPLPSIASEIACESWAQLALKFVIAHPAVTCVIPATSDVGHLRDFIAAGSGVLPDQATCAKISQAAS